MFSFSQPFTSYGLSSPWSLTLSVLSQSLIISVAAISVPSLSWELFSHLLAAAAAAAVTVVVRARIFMQADQPILPVIKTSTIY
jgi:hypothetical protein